MSAPFPFIEELKDLEYIRGINDVLKIMSFVYETVPWFKEPYTDEIKYNYIEPLYNKFKKFELGGWCGLNAEFFKWLIEGYRRKDFTLRFRSYNFGMSNSLPKIEKYPYYRGFTHIGVLVEIDRMEYFFDPYFARYFVHSDGYPLQFKDLLYLISERKFDIYRSEFLSVKKPVLLENEPLKYISPQNLMGEVIDVFKIHNLNKHLKEVFGTENPDSLMLIKIPE